MEKHSLKFFLFILFFSLAIVTHAKTKIITTFSILEDIAAHLANDEVEIINLVPAGSDPHLFEPGPSDLIRIRSAKILFANGLHFEPWLRRLVTSASKDLLVVYASRKVRARTILEQGLKIEDPHAWNSPQDLVTYIQVMGEELSLVLPKQAQKIQQRTIDLVKKIKAIDSRFKEQFASIAKTRRVMLTTHDAVGYITQAYAIKSISPIGLSTSEDFKTADLSKLLSEIKKYKIRVIFTEPNHHKLLAEKLTQKIQLELGPELYLDGLSTKGGPGDTVEKMLNHNLGKILDSMK